MEFKSID